MGCTFAFELLFAAKKIYGTVPEIAFNKFKILNS